MKVPVSLIAMDGNLLHWLRWLRQHKPDLTWQQLTIALLIKHQIEVLDNPFEYLVAIHQTRSVTEYINEFVRRSSQVPLLSDAHSLEYFLNSLHAEIQVRLRSHEMQDLYLL